MALPSPTTRLHQRLQGQIQATDTVGKKVDGLTTEINGLRGNVNAAVQTVSNGLTVGIQAIGNAGQKIDGVADKIIDLQGHLGPKLDTLSQGLTQVATALGVIQTAILAATPFPEPTEEVFKHLRVLNQVEDLVTDHDFTPDRNNSLLDQRSHQAPTRECYHALISADAYLPNSTLAQRFQAVYRHFSLGDHHERAARYLEIDQLRRDIIRALASPPGTTPGADTGRRKK